MSHSDYAPRHRGVPKLEEVNIFDGSEYSVGPKYSGKHVHHPEKSSREPLRRPIQKIIGRIVYIPPAFR